MTPNVKKVDFFPSVIFYIGETPDWGLYRREDWQRLQADSQRFKERILHLSPIISPVLTSEHRLNVQRRYGCLRPI